MTIDRDRIAAAVREILAAIGEDPSRDGLRETPTRVADAMTELYAGVGVDATDGLRDTASTADVVSTDPVIVRDLAFRSMCEHHLLPFHGVAHIAYEPTDTVVGLGRIARVLDTISSRPQVQERIGLEVCDALTDGASASGALVVLNARHECVSARGAKQAEASAITVTATGTFAVEPTRSALLALIGREMANRPLVFGVLNVTPDSFSDGGRWDSPDSAIQHAREMVAAGADVIDVGGESTRPGASRIDDGEERRRVEPVIRALVADGISVSLDTMRAETARLGIGLGVDYINDVSGGLSDPAMLGVVSGADLTYIAMHWRGESDVMEGNATYRDVTRDVVTELRARIDAALDAGIAPGKLWIDPGLGFAKTADHNWQLLRDLDQFVALGYPVLVGASRKRFLAPFGENPADRDQATAIISVLSAESGVAGVRVHDVSLTVDALRVRRAWHGGAA